MSIEERWLLPDGVEDVLPPTASELEAVRRRLLDLFSSWGYEYVIPPMVEFIESLLTGTGRDLDLQTFKVVDLITGRTMGVRADITPQVARIDAHSLNREGVVRLSYAGTVMRSKAESQLANRTPLSVGAELFGDTSNKADIEIVGMMIDALTSLGCDQVQLDLGDVSIFRQIVESLVLSEAQQDALFAAVQRKSVAEINKLADEFDLTEQDREMLSELPGLTGGLQVLERAKDLFADRRGILDCIENLEALSSEVSRRFSNLDVYFDLSELRGYAYHTGIVFAAYVDGSSQIAAKGGRYDHIGGVFGREGRGATGFSVDVKALMGKTRVENNARQTVIVIGKGDEAALWSKVAQLRQDGYVVIESGNEENADHVLQFAEGEWQLSAN